MTMMFLFIIMGATHGNAPVGIAGLAIGLLAYVDRPDQRPRDEYLGESSSRHWPGDFCWSWAIRQLWLFTVAPPIGGALGGIFYRWRSERPAAPVVCDAQPFG
jgi:aquaporin Z